MATANPLPPFVPRVRKHRRWTYADLEALPESLQRTESIDGDLVMSPSPHAARHQSAVLNLALMLQARVKPRKLGRVYVAPTDVVLSDRRVVQPDVFFVRADRLGIVDAAVRGVPDLVAEVLSPGNARLDRTVKFRIYEDEGVPECRLAEPRTRTAEVFTLTADGYRKAATATSGDTFASVLLAGLSLPVNDVFDDTL